MSLERWMEEAIELALRGRGAVEPNPRVGALAIAGDRVVGRGWHRAWGAPHAEVEALADARRAGATVDTVVVTLEPCSTPLGVAGKKTPPCVQALLDAGVRRVVIGQNDPDTRHRGRGIGALESGGVDVVDGVLASRCRALNRPFERWLGLDRPWTIAKYAMTLDGKIAAPTGESRWISCDESRRRVHELRTRVDAAVVGFGTVRADDPLLTVRAVSGPQPVRIVVDPLVAIDDETRLVQTAREFPLWLIARDDADPVRIAHLADRGVEVIRVPPADDARRVHVLEAWRELRRRGLRRILVEGGGGLLAALLAWDCVDQVIAFLAPKMVGGRLAPTPVGGDGRPFMAQAWRFDELHWRASGDDLEVGAFANATAPTG